MDFGLAGKTALVTGASKGIGRAIVHALGQEGAHVLACARGEEGLSKLKAEVGTKFKLDTFAGDLTNMESREALIAHAKSKFGTVDILIHNVGGPSPSEAKETTLYAWAEGFDRLFNSVVHLNQAFLPDMTKQNWGRVICVTSLSVIEPIAGLAVSNSIRSAVTAMLKTLSDEVASQGVTVNCVAPGLIATERLSQLMESRIAKSGQSKEEYEKQMLSSVPAGRLGAPEEFANVVAFLASDKASYVTGSTISIDGGKRRSTY